MISYVAKPAANIKIVAIPDSYTVIINAGSEIGVETYDRIEIVAKGVSIVDPDSKEVLGIYGESKEHLDVVAVQPRMSVCKKRHDDFMGVTAAIAALGTAMYRSSYAALDVNENEVGLPEEPEDPTISVGNSVRWLKRIELPDTPSLETGVDSTTEDV